MRVGAFERTKDNKFRKIDKGSRNRPEYKSHIDIQREANIIKTQNPDFLILTEVETNAAGRFNTEYLGGLYDVYSVKGNDQRGIDIVMMVKKSLRLVGEYRTNKNLKWYDPASKQELFVFSRDFPVLILKRPNEKNPVLILTATHSKSKRDRPGDPLSHKWRAKQYEVMAQIINNLEIEFPGVPLVMGGDYNTEVRASKDKMSDEELKPMRSVTKDAFDIAEETISADDRITHSYFPSSKPGRVNRSQLDTFLVRLGSSMRVLKTKVLPYTNASGEEIALPRSYQERSRQPSDHNPIIMWFEIRK